MASLEVPRSALTVGEKIGMGNFGIVCKGIATVLPGQTANNRTDVAVKYLQSSTAEVEGSAFISEAHRMRTLSHPNVVRLLAVCFKDSPNFIVVEYMSNGDLRGYLRLVEIANPHALNIQHFAQLTKEIVSGVAYLHSKNYVHRDLAARNILLDSSFQAKISDFGMSRHVLTAEVSSEVILGNVMHINL